MKVLGEARANVSYINADERQVSLMTQKRLAIIHTVPVTIASLNELCSRLLPGVEVSNYLDDSVLRQINEEGGINPSVRYRFQSLIGVAAASKPDAILCACSSVGGMLEEARAMFSVPLVRIDEPMAREAAAQNGRIVVCATVQSTLLPTTELIQRYLGQDRHVDTLLIEGAGKLLASGDRETYLALIASRLGEAASGHDVVVLAQASMAEAVRRMPESEHGKFLTSPERGVSALRGLFGL